MAPAEALAQAVDARTEPPTPAEPADIQDADIVPNPDEQAAQEAADEQARQEVLAMQAEHTGETDPLHYEPDEIAEGS